METMEDSVVEKLRSQKENLESKLKERCSELKKLCIAEAELTGVLPMEIPLEPGESPPKIRRRVGTMYPYSEDILNRLRSREEKSAKRKIPLGSWNENNMKRTENPSSPTHYTWSSQNVVSPKRKTVASRTFTYVHKLKIIKKW